MKQITTQFLNEIDRAAMEAGELHALREMKQAVETLEEENGGN